MCSKHQGVLEAQKRARSTKACSKHKSVLEAQERAQSTRGSVHSIGININCTGLLQDPLSICSRVDHSPRGSEYAHALIKWPECLVRHNPFFFRASRKAARDMLHSLYPHGKDLYLWFRIPVHSIGGRVPVRRWHSIAITLCSPGYLVLGPQQICEQPWQKD